MHIEGVQPNQFTYNMAKYFDKVFEPKGIHYAKKNDIIPFNPAHRVRKKHFEKEVQHIPQKYEMRKLMQTIRDEPILYRAYYCLLYTSRCV